MPNLHHFMKALHILVILAVLACICFFSTLLLISVAHNIHPLASLLAVLGVVFALAVGVKRFEGQVGSVSINPPKDVE